MAVTITATGNPCYTVKDLTGVREGAMYTLSTPSGMYFNMLVIDSSKGMARWRNRMLLIPSANRRVVDQFINEQADQIADELLDPGVGSLRTLRGESVTKIVISSAFNDAMCATLAFGVFDWGTAGSGFRLGAQPALGTRHLSNEHGGAHLSAALFGASTPPLVSWLCVLVSASHPNLSPDLIFSLVSCRYARVLSESESKPADRKGTPYQLIRSLVSPGFRSNRVVSVDGSLTDDIWWYAYRITCIFADRVRRSSGSTDTVEPDWVKVDPREHERCSGDCAARTVSKSGVRLFGQRHADDYDLADYEFFVPAAGYVTTPVDLSHLDRSQMSSLSEMIVGMIQSRLLDLTVNVVNDVLESYKDPVAEFGLIVAKREVSWLALAAGFFERAGEYADWVLGGGVASEDGPHTLKSSQLDMYHDPFVWGENLIDTSSESFGDVMELYDIIGEDYIERQVTRAGRSMGDPESTDCENEESWIEAELEMVGNISVQGPNSVTARGVDNITSFMFYAMLNWETGRQVLIRLVEYYTDPELFSTLSLDWFFRLNGIAVSNSESSQED